MGKVRKRELAVLNRYLPWAQSRFYNSTAHTSIFECILRIEYSDLCEVKRLYRKTKVPLLREIAKWRIFDPRWNELVKVLDERRGILGAENLEATSKAS